MWRLALTQPGTPLIRLYAGLDTHADSLLLGCAAGLLMSSGRLSTTNGVARGAIRIGGVIGAIALALLFIKSTFPGGYVLHQASVLTALASVLVIVDLCVPGSWLAHGLERPPLVGIGRISYAAYQWHFPIFYPASFYLSQARPKVEGKKTRGKIWEEQPRSGTRAFAS